MPDPKRAKLIQEARAMKTRVALGTSGPPPHPDAAPPLVRAADGYHDREVLLRGMTEPLSDDRVTVATLRAMSLAAQGDDAGARRVYLRLFADARAKNHEGASPSTLLRALCGQLWFLIRADEPELFHVVWREALALRKLHEMVPREFNAVTSKVRAESAEKGQAFRLGVVLRSDTMDEAKLRRIQQLIALAGSDNENEARNAAFTACRLMREEGYTLSEALAKAALPPGPGWTPPPEPQGRYAPSQGRYAPPQEDYPQLPQSTDLAEQNRILQRQAEMRAAQAARARYQLSLADARISELERDKAELRKTVQRRGDQVRQLQAVLGPAPKGVSVKPLPVGAGKKECP